MNKKVENKFGTRKNTHMTKNFLNKFQVKKMPSLLFFSCEYGLFSRSEKYYFLFFI